MITKLLKSYVRPNSCDVCNEFLYFLQKEQIRTPYQSLMRLVHLLHFNHFIYFEVDFEMGHYEPHVMSHLQSDSKFDFYIS